MCEVLNNPSVHAHCEKRVSHNGTTRTAFPSRVPQFEFLEWTADTHLRHSKFIGLCDDKKGKDDRGDVVASSGSAISGATREGSARAAPDTVRTNPSVKPPYAGAQGRWSV